MKVWWIFTPPQAIQDVVEFGLASFAHQWMLCSEWVPSEWESKQLIKHNNNPQVILTTPVHQIREVKISIFLRNKYIIKKC